MTASSRLYHSGQRRRDMVPIWLTTPPTGLTEAERRVLEAFFVAEDVKAAADLLRLAPKTIQNELLLARQTMGESKSWMAAIRYVFHVKRQGYGFAEPHLVPKIERQIRRLIDDYLEVTEARAGQESATTTTAVVPQWLDDAGSWGGGREIVPGEVGPHDLVAEEQFETQLMGLTRVASIVYERSAKQRKMRVFVSLAVAGLLVAAAWGYLARGRDVLTPGVAQAISIDEIEAGLKHIQTDIKLRGVQGATTRGCALLVDKLCERYHEELFGPKESVVINVFQTYPQEIEAGTDWAVRNDSVLALHIFGNGHRAFWRAKALKDGQWFRMLRKVVTDNAGDRGVYMVRALCGQIFGCLNDTKTAEVPMTSRDNQKLVDLSITLLQKLGAEISDRHDQANALRHVAMTHNTDDEDTKLRIALCNQAKAIFEGIQDEQATWGAAQCLLSIAESASDKQLVTIRRALHAWPSVKATGNIYAERSCAEIIASNIPKALTDPQQRKDLQVAREILWQYAPECGSAERTEYLNLCLKIDGADTKKNIPVDIQELLIKGQGGSWRDHEIHDSLVGYVIANLQQNHIEPKPEMLRSMNMSKGAAYERGTKLSDSEAIDLVTRGKW